MHRVPDSLPVSVPSPFSLLHPQTTALTGPPPLHPPPLPSLLLPVFWVACSWVRLYRDSALWAIASASTELCIHHCLQANVGAYHSWTLGVTHTIYATLHYWQMDSTGWERTLCVWVCVNVCVGACVCHQCVCVCATDGQPYVVFRGFSSFLDAAMQEAYWFMAEDYSPHITVQCIRTVYCLSQGQYKDMWRFSAYEFRYNGF